MHALRLGTTVWCIKLFYVVRWFMQLMDMYICKRWTVDIPKLVDMDLAQHSISSKTHGTSLVEDIIK